MIDIDVTDEEMHILIDKMADNLHSKTPCDAYRDMIVSALGILVSKGINQIITSRLEEREETKNCSEI